MDLIIEQVQYNPKISGVKDLSDPKFTIVEFDAIIQTLNDVNQNGRLYPDDILMPKIEEYVKNKVEAGTAIGELDHPVVDQSTNVGLSRQMVVLYKEASHRFLKIWREGDKILQRIRTLRTNNGQQMAGLILDGINVGFSLRAFGGFENRIVNGKPVKYINNIQKVMTWDCVSDPSHKRARMTTYNLNMENINTEITDSKELQLVEGNGILDENSLDYRSFVLEELNKQKVINSLFENQLGSFLQK